MINLPPKIERVIKKEPFILFDVGARGGAGELLKLAPLVRAYGFEPDPTAFAELEQSSKTYAWQQYFPLALGERPGRRAFRLARHPSYSSFLGVDWATHQHHLQLMPQYEKWKRDMAAEKEIEVEVATLDGLLARESLSRIDFLKLDTQGTELKILRGGKGLLARGAIGLIKCEVSFIPFYEGQCLFADVDSFLRAHGYRFVDCLFYPEVAHGHRSKQRPSGITARERLHFGMGGDAIYYRFPEAGDTAAAMKTGVLLAAHGYYSPALEVLKVAGLTPGEIEGLFSCLARLPWPARLKELAKQWIPPAARQWARNVILLC